VGNHFRKLWGKEAGWAHSVLFTADLRTFSDRLVASKKAEVKVKIKDEEDEKGESKIITGVTTALAVGVKRSASESEVKVEPGEENVRAAVEEQTTIRRMSKRLRNR
jgi:N-glycosylase/DNA lyase